MRDPNDEIVNNLLTTKAEIQFSYFLVSVNIKATLNNLIHINVKIKDYYLIDIAQSHISI